MFKACIFCNQQIKKKSLEHVIPKWLQLEMGMSKKLFTGQRFSAFTGETLDKRSHAAMSNVCSLVCGDCNSGWMSSLELRVKSFLPAMIAGGNVKLLKQDVFHLSRWLAKTSYVGNIASSNPSKVPAKHTQALYRLPYELPKHVIVVCGRNPEYVDLEVIHHSAWSRQFLNDQSPLFMEQTVAISYKFAIQLGHFMGMVACWNADGFIYGVEKGFQKVFYLHNPDHFEHQSRTVEDQASVFQLFHRMLSVHPK